MTDNEPVAWRVFDTDGSEAVYLLYEQARAAADEWNWCITPLYRSPTLTDEEREAVEFFADIHCDDEPPHEYAATLRKLLERLK